MNPKTSERFPIGATVTLDQLGDMPYSLFDDLRDHEPVSWIPELGGWFVTRRDLAVKAMRDADAFTVDDPRFSTAVVLGPSMLSLDGDDHVRHRSPFAPAFRPAVVRDQFEDFLADESRSLIDCALAGSESGAEIEFRTQLAGPLAVAAITEFLGLVDVSADEVLSWYTNIAAAIVAVTVGEQPSSADANAIRELRQRVHETLTSGDDTSLLRQIASQGVLQPDEMASAAAVLMFGAIETSEGMTANALWHLLSRPDLVNTVRSDRSLVASVVEESLRLEPAAAFVDRYATDDVVLGDVTIPHGDLVTLSLLAANRDPAVFDKPHEFQVNRANTRQHVTFVQGPHGCIGLHLARLETISAVNAVLDLMPQLELELDPQRSSRPQGLIFRKPESVWAIAAGSRTQM